MTLSNRDLITRFIEGSDSGKASRMELRSINDCRFIVGYGWAVYAAASPAHYYLFGDGYKTDRTHKGWAGYSGTTTGHLQSIKGALESEVRDYHVVDHRLKAKDVQAKPPDGVAAYLDELRREHEIEPLEYSGHYYQKPE